MKYPFSEMLGMIGKAKIDQTKEVGSYPSARGWHRSRNAW
jgi:hypothetical protein